MQTLTEHRCFDGIQGFYQHDSDAIGLPMRFSVFQPASAHGGPRPALIYLAGLTCTEETFAIKAGAQRVAAELGLTLIAPDTSPRNTGIEGATRDWDFGEGAGFYLDATEAPWNKHFRMASWITGELLPLVTDRFGLDPRRIGITGHSMGGHGALTLALKHRETFRSVSALAPIAAPSECPWGVKAFTGYLGTDRAAWLAHDACALLRATPCPFPAGLLVDQGLADKFLTEQLHPDRLESACRTANQPLTLRRHDGYDHGYYFVASIIEHHLRFHAERLAG
ncbi:MAG: S-formylglutathione hydrolase [Pelomonas sp.]|nr:S-formylglutathione hydrolase [Roseateles sp.]